MSYRNEPSWRERWQLLTGVLPDPSLEKRKAINGSAKGQSGHTLRDDAMSLESRRFRRR